MSYTAVSDEDLWASLAAVGLNAEPATEEPIRLAFYGRCSTEDLQDPETSLAWQMSAARNLVRALGLEAEIVTQYFDVGHSRALPWKRRPEAQRLLRDLEAPGRLWNGVIVGEGQRCWLGSQFSDVAPVFVHHGVEVFVPELGGRYDPKNSTHNVLMSVTGGMSQGERQRVQERVRLGMAAQVETHGRFQGGKPPYGYRLVGYAPHPNPRKAAEGVEIKQLVPEESEAAVVIRIFEEWLDGRSLREIARRLNSDSISAPSGTASDPAASPWRPPTVRNILSNPRYTGYEVWGKQTRHESLVDPSDPSWGYHVRFVPSDAAPSRSRERVHEPIIALADFARAQLIRASKAETGLKAPRIAGGGVVYPLRSVLVCAVCERSMGAERVGTKNDPERPTDVRYRCRARDLPQGHTSIERHPANVRIKQAEVLDLLHGWFGDLLSASSRHAVLAAYAHEERKLSAEELRQNQARKALADAEARMNRLHRAIEQGVDPVGLVDRVNQTGAEIRTLKAELSVPTTAAPTLSVQDLGGLLDSFAGAAGEVFGPQADYAELNEFLRSVNLRLVYDVYRETLAGSLSWTPGATTAVGLPGSTAMWRREHEQWHRVLQPSESTPPPRKAGR